MNPRPSGCVRAAPSTVSTNQCSNTLRESMLDKEKLNVFIVVKNISGQNLHLIHMHIYKYLKDL